MGVFCVTFLSLSVVQQLTGHLVALPVLDRTFTGAAGGILYTSRAIAVSWLVFISHRAMGRGEGI